MTGLPRPASGDLAALDAIAAADEIRAGRLTSEALVQACLDRIAVRDEAVRAWTHLDPEAALAAARAADRSAPQGLLHGVPVGIKDVIRTADMPTGMNSPHHQSDGPTQDAAAVEILRHHGAIVLGKLDTVEFAVNGRRAATRNPHDPAHTPGGSSSGSGAAVADFQVPLALGTQTGGSVIRPAAFCGVPAMKPSWGSVPTEGMRSCSASLDTLGWYGRSVRDLALLWRAFQWQAALPVAPEIAGLRIGLCLSPVADLLQPPALAALAMAAEALRGAGAEVIPVELPEPEGARLSEAHKTVMQGEMRATFLNEALRFPDLYPELRGIVTAPMQDDFLDALDFAAAMRPRTDALFAPFDAVLTPSAPDVAPIGPENTGGALCNRIWTLLHLPVIHLPLPHGPGLLPAGVSLIAPRGRDAALLNTATALEGLFATCPPRGA
ncbi:amidase [Salipiger abyssi]|uniref:amidase n=1 Tax=Salipiger abyssi TaxID=1250539 RepID=UPI001A8F6B31|nr:amidase [Salipiger abyssi]MBN9888259.1 amidase [Salipiger abyssi]